MNVTVIGTGAFGYAIAKMLYKNGNNIIMWTHNKEEVDLLQKGKKEIIPGQKIPKDIKFTNNYEEALKDAEIVFIMVAAKYVGDVAANMKPFINDKMHFCIGSKGIEQGSCKFVHQVFNDYIKTKYISVISGPSFAIDVVNNEPIGFAIASKSFKTKSKIKKALTSDTIKLRNSTDIIGIEICGSIKNVIAVASGILNGLGYNESTRSFLIVESMHDIKELIRVLGGKKKTILSFAGIGDLLLTCTSEKSRNYSYGILIGKGKKDQANKYLETNTVEGYYTLKSIYTLLRRKRIKMPVIDLIYKIIMKDADPNLLVDFLIKKK
ncbi:MAG: NAD(P)-dependent glycerol-3-phosphate dehydrogenase [Bacilli bacterium]|nr:NAD(P)-dependent glycerol-3-phosphate dehydrogenase [Bacilli bacterium]MDD3895480.1 NAD(P)-dependent glycerol-3-phosphate dehydrogenase [Bacilli bacterium]MDD4407431.1 NAD(P)-dependent glycerol-3-phosphate dehydrogenase [Bacilli bacterium]